MKLEQMLGPGGGIKVLKRREAGERALRVQDLRARNSRKPVLEG